MAKFLFVWPHFLFDGQVFISMVKFFPDRYLIHLAEKEFCEVNSFIIAHSINLISIVVNLLDLNREFKYFGQLDRIINIVRSGP
jgi:hypothetical protein